MMNTKAVKHGMKTNRMTHTTFCQPVSSVAPDTSVKMSRSTTTYATNTTNTTTQMMLQKPSMTTPFRPGDPPLPGPKCEQSSRRAWGQPGTMPSAEPDG